MTEEWAAALWQRFKDHYGQKWTSLFQGPEAIESWRITWSEINANAEQIRYALSRIGVDFPDWPPTFGQFKSLCADKKPLVALPAPEKRPPSQESLERMHAMVDKIGNRTGPYWTPDKVVNESQVNFIVLQARHFGHLSTADRFLTDCIDAGVISSDFRLIKPEHRNLREPGEDSEEANA